MTAVMSKAFDVKFSGSVNHTHSHIHTHTCTHTHIHILMYTHTHAQICTHLRTHSHIHITHTHSYIKYINLTKISKPLALGQLQYSHQITFMSKKKMIIFPHSFTLIDGIKCS